MSFRTAPPRGIYVRAYSKVCFFSGKPALFIDRDGVVVEEVDYLCREKDVSFIKGALGSIARLNGQNIPVVMVTNQAGVGRGYFGWKEFEGVQTFIEDELGKEGGRLDAVLACPFHEDGVGVFRVKDHPFRKPNPGMMLYAAGQLGIALERSWMVGDKLCDIEAAVRAGLKGAVHVETGHGGKERTEVVKAFGNGPFEIICAESISAVTELMIERLGGRE